MQKIILIFLMAGTVILFYSCKDDDNTVDPGPDLFTSENFPSGEGSTYKYSVATTDSAGTPQQGTRTTIFSGTEAIGSTQYQVQRDSLFLAGQSSVTLSHFRKTSGGLYYYLDTTGLSASIPDSLQQYISTDAEFRALTFPLNDGSSWVVYQINLNYGPIVFNPVVVNGNYAGTENITLNLTSGQVNKQAVKIRYVLRLTLQYGQPAISYESYAWVVQDIGFVKWEGNAAILNGVSGGGVDLGDTSRVVTQNLIEYSIQ